MYISDCNKITINHTMTIREFPLAKCSFHDGKFNESIEMSLLGSQYFYYPKLKMDAMGNIILQSDTNIAVINPKDQMRELELAGNEWLNRDLYKFKIPKREDTIENIYEMYLKDLKFDVITLDNRTGEFSKQGMADHPVNGRSFYIWDHSRNMKMFFPAHMTAAITSSYLCINSHSQNEKYYLTYNRTTLTPINLL